MYAYIKSQRSKPTPPAPTDAEVQEARRLLEIAVGSIVGERGAQAIFNLRIIFAALDRALREIGILKCDTTAKRRSLEEWRTEEASRVEHMNALRAENSAQAEQNKRLRVVADEAEKFRAVLGPDKFPYTLARALKEVSK